LKRKTDKVEILTYADHHPFTKSDLEQINSKFNEIVNINKIIITTEKDMIRLTNDELKPQVDELPFFYLPVEVVFHKSEETNFDQLIEKKLSGKKSS
jgi:tetraacyldisaccharide 4'-kinase